MKEDDPTLQTFFYKTEKIVLAVPCNYAINQRLLPYKCKGEWFLENQWEQLSAVPPVPLSEFADMPFVLLKDGNDLGARGIQMCQEAGFYPRIAILADQILTTANIAANGVGAVFLRADLFHYYSIQDKFCLYVLDSPLSERKIFFASKKGRYVSNAMKTFLRIAGISQTNSIH